MICQDQEQKNCVKRLNVKWVSLHCREAVKFIKPIGDNSK